MASIGCGQYRSAESEVYKACLSGDEIRAAGKKAIAGGRAAKAAKYAEPLDKAEGTAFIKEVRGKLAAGGRSWVAFLREVWVFVC